MKLKQAVLVEINRLNRRMVQMQKGSKIMNVTVLQYILSWSLLCTLPACVQSGVPSAGPASQVQELRTWREHYKVSLEPEVILINTSQGLALAAKAAGNKEEALNNMKYIKVISA